MGGTVEGWNELENLERQEIEKNQEVVRDRLVQLSSDIYGHSSAYDNAVMIAGYAAFFALWSGVSNDISLHGRLMSVALMGASLMLYIGWQIGNMLVRQKYDAELAKTLAYADDPERFNQNWAALTKRKQIAGQRIMRFWPTIFLPSVAFGFAGGGLLSYHALAAVVGWPQLGQ